MPAGASHRGAHNRGTTVSTCRHPADKPLDSRDLCAGAGAPSCPPWPLPEQSRIGVLLRLNAGFLASSGLHLAAHELHLIRHSKKYLKRPPLWRNSTAVPLSLLCELVDSLFCFNLTKCEYSEFRPKCLVEERCFVLGLPVPGLRAPAPQAAAQRQPTQQTPSTLKIDSAQRSCGQAARTSPPGAPRVERTRLKKEEALKRKRGLFFFFCQS